MAPKRNGCIYMIWSPSTPKVYIGSTAWLAQRRCHHAISGQCSSQQIICFPDWQILILEDNIKSKEERRRLEQLHIEGWGDLAVNKVRAFVGIEQQRLETNARQRQWYLQNHEYRVAYMRRYRRDNRAYFRRYHRAYYHSHKGNEK